MSELEITKFNTEAEEADWWHDHRDQVEASFVQAAKEGRLQRRESLDAPVSHSATNIAVEPYDVDLALSQARRKGVSFEDHARLLFHRAVQAEEQELAG